MRKFLLCTVLVLLFFSNASAGVPVTGVTLDKQSAIITLGGVWEWVIEVFNATVKPENATNKKVTWSSSNEAIATVSGGGLVTGIGPGVAIITVTTEDGGFKSQCAVGVNMSDIQRATPQHSTDKGEVAAKTDGFSEYDFDIVDGKVVIKKSITEAIAKELLETDDIEVFPLPWLEAKFYRNGQNGRIASIITPVKRSMLDSPVDFSKTLLLSINSPNTGEFLKYDGNNPDDGKFLFSPPIQPTVDPYPEDNSDYEMYVFIRDGGRYDLDKAVNGSVFCQLAIVGKAKSETKQTEPKDPKGIVIDNSRGGGCNAVYCSLLLLLGYLWRRLY